MNRATIAASVTLGQLQQKLNTVADNLANLDTNGFKRRDMTFSDLLTQQINNVPANPNETGRLTPAAIRAGNGAAVSETMLQLSQGAIQKTDRMLDLALTEENLFFQIETDGNIQYTRDGAFYITQSATPGLLNIVSSDGSALLGTDGPLQIPNNYKEIIISNEGIVSVQLQNNASVTVGQLQLADIQRPQLLESVGQNRYRAPNPEQSGIALNDILQTVAGTPSGIQQGALEASNVDVAHEMTQMLDMQRHYQFNSRSVSLADDMMGLVNQLR